MTNAISWEEANDYSGPSHQVSYELSAEELEQIRKEQLKLERQQEEERLQKIRDLEEDIFKNPLRRDINVLKITMLDKTATQDAKVIAETLLTINDNISKKQPDLKLNTQHYNHMQENMKKPFWTHLDDFIKKIAEVFMKKMVDKGIQQEKLPENTEKAGYFRFATNDDEKENIDPKKDDSSPKMGR